MLLRLRKIFTNEYLLIFSRNYFVKKGKILMFFWKGNKTKAGNKDALESGRDRYNAKNYITT